jgi:hypothetical protein
MINWFNQPDINRWKKIQNSRTNLDSYTSIREKYTLCVWFWSHRIVCSFHPAELVARGTHITSLSYFPHLSHILIHSLIRFMHGRTWKKGQSCTNHSSTHRGAQLAKISFAAPSATSSPAHARMIFSHHGHDLEVPLTGIAVTSSCRCRTGRIFRTHRPPCPQ